MPDVAEMATTAAPAARDTRIEKLFEDWNLTFELDDDMPLARVKFEPGAQVREEEHRAPASTVAEYQTHMTHGAIFPPIIVSSQNFLIDGNTRVKAALRLGRKTFPAYRVKFPHLGMAKMVGAAINQMGGDRLTEAEIVAAASVMMKEGYSDEAIARTLGRSPSHVRNVRKDQAFTEAAARTGLADIRIPKQHRRTLSRIAHDEPFAAAVKIIAASTPPNKEVTALVDKIDQTRSDAEALAVIEAARSEWGAPAGPPPIQRSPTSRTYAKRALAHARDLLKLGDDPLALVLPDNPAALKSWQELVVLATHVVALYPKPA